MPANRNRPAGKLLSHPVRVEEVPEQGLDVAIAADAQTCQALAECDGLAGIDRLEADFHIARRGRTEFNVSGTLRASVTQVCVLSLEPFDTEVVAEIDVDFAPPPVARAAARAATLLRSPGTRERDPPDAIVDGTIDVGALAAEFLALGLDHYPKKPGVEFKPMTGAGESAQKPFDILKKLTDRS